MDSDQLEPGCSIILAFNVLSVAGVLADDADPMISVMKVDKALLKSCADIGGKRNQTRETKEAVELSLNPPELCKDTDTEPSNGANLWGEHDTAKTLLAEAVAKSTSASLGSVVESVLIQKKLGDGPELVQDLICVSWNMVYSISFLEQCDSTRTERHDSVFNGKLKIQRTSITLVNLLDSFDSRWNVKLFLATNRA